MIPLSKADVIIVGAGPSGLAAATELARLGVRNVVVLEREPEAGGIPRHCGHPPFGMREFHHIYTGPQYARKLVRRAINAGVEVLTGTSVMALHNNGGLTVSDNSGLHRLEARRVLLSTGVRETPRSARLVSGARPAGVMTTGALQSTVYLKKRRPFMNPVIVGTELVSFSALLTCRHAGIRPLAMIEGSRNIVARKGAGLLPRLLGIPIRYNTTIKRIVGDHQVRGVELDYGDDSVDRNARLDCDGVIFTGQFVPEASLCRSGHLEIDEFTGGPLVDQLGRCSDTSFFATGNLLRPVETAGWCWQEGKRVATAIANDLKHADLNHGSWQIVIDQSSREKIKYVMPGRLSLAPDNLRVTNCATLQIRLNQPASGVLELNQGDRLIASKKIDSLPERRVLMPVKIPLDLDSAVHLSLGFRTSV